MIYLISKLNQTLKRSLLLLILLLPACCKETIQEKKITTLNLNLYEEPLSLDPRTARNLKDLTLVKQLFEGLYRLDEKGVPEQAISEKTEISEDGLTYTFTLRESKWTNGEPVTSKDFEYAWTKVLDPNFACDYAYMLYPIKNAKLYRSGQCDISKVGIRAPDDKTLVVTLENPTPYFLELTAFPTYFPVNRNIDLTSSSWASPPGRQFISNGPFTLKNWVPEDCIKLEKSSHYWDSKAVHLTDIAFTIIADNITESYLYEKDKIDWLGQPLSQTITPELMGKLKAQGSLHSYDILGTFWLVFNTKKAPFNDPDLRKALSLAIDRKEIITYVLQGNQKVATSPLPPQIALQETPYFKDHDTKLAKELLDSFLQKNGLKSENLKFVLTYIPTERNRKIVQIVAEAWRRNLGFAIELEGLERNYQKQKLKSGDFMIATADWVADFKDPLAFLEIFKYDIQSGNGMNSSQWQNEKYITLLDRALVEVNTEKRKEFLHEAEKILMNEMPIAPLYHYSFDYAKKEDVSDVFLSPIGTADFKKAAIVKKQR